MVKKKTFKLVGIHIDEKLKWTEHIKIVSRKLNHATYALRKVSNLISTENKKLLYSGLIHSHLTYGLPIWGNTSKANIKTLLVKQKKAIRKVYNLSNREHTKPFFIMGKILQMPELIDHTTITYIQSGTHENSPEHITKLWNLKPESSQNLRDTRKKFIQPMTKKQWILNLPAGSHAQIWNNSSFNHEQMKLKPQEFKELSKRKALESYQENLTEEEQEIYDGIMENFT